MGLTFTEFDKIEKTHSAVKKSVLLVTTYTDQLLCGYMTMTLSHPQLFIILLALFSYANSPKKCLLF